MKEDFDKDKDEEQNEISMLLNHYRDLLTRQYNYAIEWQELADYILPRKNSILVNRIPGWKRTQKLYDSTAPDNADKLAASIHSTLTPSFTKWFHLELEDQEMNNLYEVKLWLDKTTKQINAALNKSNFNSEAHEAYIDLVTFGTACLYEDEKPEGGWWGGLNFTSIGAGKFVVSEGPDGKVDTVYRSFPMPLHAIKTQWPGRIPKELEDSPKINEEHEIIHAVYPIKSKNYQNYQWESKYILYKTRTLLDESGYFNFPFLVPRWTKNADESYGRGPSHTALPDIRTLNKLVEMELRALAKVVDPPLGVVNGDVIGAARMIPGGITTVRTKEGIFPIQTGYNYQVSNLKKEELRASIEKMYYSEQLQMINGPQMTATEVNVRFELMQRILGPILGRLESEFTKPLLNRTFYLMYRAGLFNPIPAALQRKQQKGPIILKVRYEGSLARAQRASDVSAIQQFEQIMTPIIQIDPESASVVDFDAMTRHIAEVLDVPTNVIRDKDQVEAIRQAHEQQVKMQQQMQGVSAAGETAKNIAPLLRAASEKIKSGSMIDQGT